MARDNDERDAKGGPTMITAVGWMMLFTTVVALAYAVDWIGDKYIDWKYPVHYVLADYVSLDEVEV